MRIPNIKKEDCGTYCCIAENGFGRSAHHKVLIEVQFGPVITVPNPYVAQNLQNNLSLKCHIEAFPSPAIVWLKNGVQISNNQHYRYTLLISRVQFQFSVAYYLVFFII